MNMGMDQVTDKLMLDKGLRHKKIVCLVVRESLFVTSYKEKKQQSIYILLCYVKNIYDGWRTCVMDGNWCTLCDDLFAIFTSSAAGVRLHRV